MPHAALADRCQKSVFAQYKTSLAFHQLTGLPLRQQAQGDEFRSQTFNGSCIRVGGAVLLQFLRGDLRSVPLRRSQQCALFEQRQKNLHMQLRHCGVVASDLSRLDGGEKWPRMLPLIDWQELICGCECENSH